MKFNLKNRPKYTELDDVGGMEPIEVQMWGARIDEWFEGFEKELREMFAENERGGEFWSLAKKNLLKEVLGE